MGMTGGGNLPDNSYLVLCGLVLFLSGVAGYYTMWFLLKMVTL